MPSLRKADSIRATSMGNFSRNPARRQPKAEPAKSPYSPEEIRQLQQMILVDKKDAGEAAQAVIDQRQPIPDPAD